MAKTREIKRRIKAVGNIRRITKTMQMIATARFQAALRRVTQAQPYTRKIGELVGELAVACTGSGKEDGASFSHPLLQAPSQPTHRQLLLVLTSNRGLCGGYNASLLRAATAHLREHHGQQIDLEVVGRKGLTYFRFIRQAVAAAHTQFSETPQYTQVEQLAESYIQAFTEGRYDRISVVYMAFESVGRQHPTVLTLLPLRNPALSSNDKLSAKPQPAVDYDFSPEPQQLLDELLPVTVKTQLFQCFNEAALGEHIARMVAMKNATDSAVKMSKELTRRYNRARQAAITTELTEIIGGAAALT